MAKGYRRNRLQACANTGGLPGVVSGEKVLVINLGYFTKGKVHQMLVTHVSFDEHILC